MYGLVNQAIHEMVLDNYDEATWERICRRAQADDVFIAMEQYPDEVTYALVGAACEELGAAPEALLEGFGRYWVGFTGRIYGHLFEMAGSSFAEMVRNLNSLHTRVGQLMPDLRPPSFVVCDESDGAFTLQYHSTRAGLHPMIVGLMHGLGDRFDTDVTVTHLRGGDDGLPHEEFRVEYRPRS